MNTLETDVVKTNLTRLHLDVKGDWKIILKCAPAMLWGLIRGKSMMKSLTPNMARNAYMSVSE